MDTQTIIEMLEAERNRITHAILILRGPNEVELLDATNPENAGVRLGRIMQGVFGERKGATMMKKFSAVTR